MLCVMFKDIYKLFLLYNCSYDHIYVNLCKIIRIILTTSIYKYHYSKQIERLSVAAICINEI